MQSHNEGFQPGPGPYPPPPGFQPPGSGYPPPQGYPPAPIYPPGRYPPPVSYQPMSSGEPPSCAEGGWMNVPTGSPLNCPPGLEYLTHIDQLLVHQKVELLEALTGFETANKYEVRNSLGQKVFYAAEQSDCCTRNCCGSWRPFSMKILDNFKNEVMHLERPLACDSCWFPCCLQKLEVYSPPGCLIGTVEQEWSILIPLFSIKNSAGDTVLRMRGPLCTFNVCCGDVEFDVLSRDGETQVGKISKQWSGLVKEAFTDADNFGLTFPMDLDVRMKAVMLGACFLIDFMYFETTPSDRQDN